VRSLTRFGGYRFGSGTSAAAPHVSGAAAITALHVHGQLGAAGIVLRPALYPQIIKECLMAAASQGLLQGLDNGTTNKMLRVPNGTLVAAVLAQWTFDDTALPAATAGVCTDLVCAMQQLAAGSVLVVASAASLVLVAIMVLRLSSKTRVWRKKLPESYV
jgi:hypothetical protein